MPEEKLVRYGLGLVALFFSGYVLLTALGRDASQIVGWITLFAGQGLTALAVLRKQHVTEGKVDAVVAQTNGAMTTLLAAKTQPGAE